MVVVKLIISKRFAINFTIFLIALMSVVWLPSVLAEQKISEGVHHHSKHKQMLGGMVMNENMDELPRGCSEISADYEFRIAVGQQYAAQVPGAVFGMSEHELKVSPCSRLTVTLVNDDKVRHQWMVHGLPKYLYRTGMFHLEAMGGGVVTGTFIVPPENRTYLVHCDMAQHMEKGMKAQLVVGSGSGDLWSVPGVTDSCFRATYLPSNIVYIFVVVLFMGLVLSSVLLIKKD
jgi:hypothetical protein